MKLIVAVTSNWGIGKDNKLLFSIPEDMKFFRTVTKGAAVIMGRKTLESFPGGNPLKGRVNIVLTKNTSLEKEGVIYVSDVPSAIKEAEQSGRDIFVIGGQSIYRLFLPYCKEAYITKMDTLLPADSYFPNLDEEDGWIISENLGGGEYEGVKYNFLLYTNSNLKA